MNREGPDTMEFEALKKVAATVLGMDPVQTPLCQYRISLPGQHF